MNLTSPEDKVFLLSFGLVLFDFQWVGGKGRWPRPLLRLLSRTSPSSFYCFSVAQVKCFHSFCVVVKKVFLTICGPLRSLGAAASARRATEGAAEVPAVPSRRQSY